MTSDPDPLAADREIDTLAEELRRSRAPFAITLAIARCDAVLATAPDPASGSVRELVALEAGAFDSPTARQPGPSPGAIAALRYLNALRIHQWNGALRIDRGNDASPGEAELIRRAVLALADARTGGATAPGIAPATARRSRALVGRLTALDDLDRARIDTLGKAAASAHRVHRVLERWPIASVTRIIETTGLQVQAVTSALHRLRGLGIVREISRRHRHRLYCYDAWITLLDDDVASWVDERKDTP